MFGFSTHSVAVTYLSRISHLKANWWMNLSLPSLPNPHHSTRLFFLTVYLCIFPVAFICPSIHLLFSDYSECHCGLHLLITVFWYKVLNWPCRTYSSVELRWLMAMTFSLTTWHFGISKEKSFIPKCCPGPLGGWVDGGMGVIHIISII